MTSSDDADIEAAGGDVEAADRRNGEPGATDWTETDVPASSDTPELETDPDDGQLPSDTDVQAERQP